VVAVISPSSFAATVVAAAPASDVVVGYIDTTIANDKTSGFVVGVDSSGALLAEQVRRHRVCT
jgi:hypothetical protein